MAANERLAIDELEQNKEIAKRLPGGPYHLSTLMRWQRRGVLGRDGNRVYLEHRRIGGKLYTTRRWVDRFFREITEADEAARPDAGQAPKRRQCKPRKPSNRTREKDLEKAERNMRREGALPAK